ncbi:hypothetical protein NIASO_05295 [Niabella soli DSM 19437]|uniref:Uncharacterized protein n=1 Tax=Niabella soli DSM 19437 TaxID=929713 RepID=W0F666_9BACT|nr:hypothetical protein NIASO_05295 [Niabella soli DSM 19437]
MRVVRLQVYRLKCLKRITPVNFSINQLPINFTTKNEPMIGAVMLLFIILVFLLQSKVKL